MKHYLILLSFLILAACSKAPEGPAPASQAQSQAPTTIEETAQIASTQWLEGTHYTVLDQGLSDSPQVQEFFSFWCPHCHNFEPIVALIKQQLDAETPFIKVHVDFMAFTTAEIQQSATTAMLVGRYLGNEDAINSDIFDLIHEERKEISGIDDFKPIFTANQVSDDMLNQALSSAELALLIKEHNDTFVQYRANIKSVPTFIVNGKYQVKFTQDMDINDIVTLVTWLTSKTE